VYVRDEKVWFEEQTGLLPVIEQGVPDMNPMGCQKGTGWSHTIAGPERVLYPLKRVGARGAGQWRRVSWDEALAEVADAIIDAIQEQGPQSIIALSGCNMSTWGVAGRGRFMGLLGGVTTDLNSEMNDFAAGHYLTYGKFDPVSSIDDWFHADLTFIWFQNPAYTRIPHIHYAFENRYKGGEVVLVAPDYSPSAMHCDYHVPVKPGCDAAFALGMCQVLISENLYNQQFVKEQTDLPLLVRTDTGRFLRQSDVQAGGSAEQFYFWDGKLVEAPRANLKLSGIDPALEGMFTATLADGNQVQVTPVFALIRAKLDAEYTPEKAAKLAELHPEMIRTLARKAAGKRVNILSGLNNASKFYHGDLMERAQLLFLALTASWGRKGTGVRAWLAALFDGWMMFQAKSGRGQEAAAQLVAAQKMFLNAVKQEDPTMTDELAAIELTKRAGNAGAGIMIPPVFLWYNHGGFDKAWDNRSWHDPSMAREFREYMQESVDRGWWAGQPDAAHEPRVFIECGGNALRRTRGGPSRLLNSLWPKLRMVCTMDYRMSTTAAYSDIVLPIANQYEKIGFGIPSTHTLNLTFCDKVVAPAGEAKNEWDIFALLAKKLAERAVARGFTAYTDHRGVAHDLSKLYDAYTCDGAFVDEEEIADEMIRDSAVSGTLPKDATLATVRERGFLRFTALGMSARALGQASEIRPDETFAPYRFHVERGDPYPTLTRRAQFYIDHEWFLEAGEQMPVHKDPPPMGGDYPFQMTSGHNRWSIHSLNIVNSLMLQTHRGVPHLVMNDRDAAARGIADDDEVEVRNDQSSFRVRVKISPGVRPGQVVIYNGWEPYQFPDWRGPMDVETGMVKWLHFAGGYGHLRFWPTEWQPAPTERATRVDVRKVG